MPVVIDAIQWDCTRGADVWVSAEGRCLVRCDVVGDQAQFEFEGGDGGFAWS
jgi:hypothetical protein